MEVEYALDVEDGVAFLRYHADHPPGPPAVRSTPWVLWLFLSVFGCIFLLHLLAGKGPVTWQQTLVPALAGLGLATCVFQRRLLAVFWRWSLRRNERFPMPQRLVISPEGIETAAGARSLRSAWDGVKKIIMTGDHALFYLSLREAIILPRRAFRDDGDFEVFVRTAERYHRAPPAPRYAITTGPAPGAADITPTVLELPVAEDRRAGSGFDMRFWHLFSMDLADLSFVGWLLVLSAVVVGITPVVLLFVWVPDLQPQINNKLLASPLAFGAFAVLACCYFEVGKRVLRLLGLRIYRQK